METYVVHVTKQCNCDCIYCYEEDKDSQYSWEDIKELLDNLIRYKSSDFHIEFLGGEPLLAWDLIKQAYEYLERNPNVYVHYYTITTNGTILTEEIIDYLQKNKKIHFAASLDGHKHANQLRVFKDNINTYDVVINNLNKLLKAGIMPYIHIVSHPYNIAFLSDSIDHLYKLGFRSIDVGTVEKTMKIDEEYCDRFIKELDIVSERIVDGTYEDLSIGLFNWIKPKDDVRTYMYDDTGRVVAESYGRAGHDITATSAYKMKKCTTQNDISDMIYTIRETVHNNHQKRLKGES